MKKDIDLEKADPKQSEGALDAEAFSAKDKKSRRLFGIGTRALTAIAVVAIIAINVLVSAIGDAELWFIDLTRGKYKSHDYTMYTLTEECKNIVLNDAVSMIDEVNAERAASGEKRIKAKIIFCADKDVIEADADMRYVSFTARALAKEFSDSIEVEYVDIVSNPSSVQKYKTTSAATVYSSDVIVEFGSEYILQNKSAFFHTDPGEARPWAYNGEQKLCAMLMSVTRTDSPVCAITVNHGESIIAPDGKVKDEYSAFIGIIEGAGYSVCLLDLERDEIPENCRMMITFDPRYDFKAYGNLGEGGVSEIEKLDKYLDDLNSFFYVCDGDTPYLANLEEYVAEWGVNVNRVTGADGGRESCTVIDREASLDPASGSQLVGKYATEGLGATLTEDMRAAAYPANVVFGNATAIVPDASYVRSFAVADEESGDEAYVYYSYFRNGVSRTMFDVFTSHKSAASFVGGEQYEIATESSLFKLMTVTQESRQVQESNLTSVNQASYVLSVSSTEFFKNEYLESAAYGNTDVLLSALRNTSNPVIPVNLDVKVFGEQEILDKEAYETSDPTVWVRVLAIVPAALAVVIGTVIYVRRKYR